MKKILYFLIAVLAMVMSSCSNDDIEITRAISVKVNPSGVIAPFTFEINTGELESFDTDNKLRVRTFAYNEKGALVAQDVQYLQNYASIASCSLNLERGTYTIVAITDIAEMDGTDVSFEYWTISGTEKLSTTKITDAGYLGGKHKILGLDIKKMTVESQNNECKLNPQPVGALCLVHWLNIHTYPSVEEYTLAMSKSSDFIQLNEIGGYDVSELNENGAFNWRLTYLDPSDYTAYDNVYGYYFVLPMKNIKFKYTYVANGEYNELSTSETVSCEAGGEYYFALNLCDENNNNTVTGSIGILLNGANSAKEYSAKVRTRNNANSLYLADYAK